MRRVKRIINTVYYLFYLMFMVVAFAACVNQSNKAQDTVESSSVEKEQVFETEQEEAERLLKERAAEEEKVYSELGIYNGVYTIITESEGVTSSLELKYNNDKTFDFKWFLLAGDFCEAKYEGKILMDQTQHGFFAGDGCTIHFNFMGNWGEGEIIEIDHEGNCKDMKGDCNFAGKYIKSN
ncbi:MAG: hypothetical protein AB1777_07730 [Bacteroidota bacterium]